MGNSLDKLRHPRSDAYSAEQVVLNKQHIWCGGTYLHCYPNWQRVPSMDLGKNGKKTRSVLHSPLANAVIRSVWPAKRKKPCCRGGHRVIGRL